MLFEHLLFCWRIERRIKNLLHLGFLSIVYFFLIYFLNLQYLYLIYLKCATFNLNPETKLCILHLNVIKEKN